MNFLDDYKKLENELLASEQENNRKKNYLLRELKATPIEEIIGIPQDLVNNIENPDKLETKEPTKLFGWLKKIFR
jgi:hypothetical protein